MVEVKDMKLTKAMKHFLYQDVLPHYIIYSPKMNRAYCTACQSDVDADLTRARHLGPTECPKCKAKAIWRAERYIRSGFEDTGRGIIYEKESDNIVIHMFELHKCYSHWGTVTYFHRHECLREYFGKNGWIKGFDYQSGWKKLNLREMGNMKGPAGEPCYHILFNWKCSNTNTYTKNIRYVIKGTPWEHSCLDKIYNLGDPHHYWDVGRTFLKDYLTCPLAEYLYKVGFYNLCQRFVFIASIPCDCTKKTIQDILCVNKEHWKALLENGNPTVEELEMRQRMTQYGFTKEEYDIFKKYFDTGYYKFKPNSRTLYDSLKPLYTKSLYKLDKYITTQTNFHIDGYIDYLNMSKELGDDMNSTFILFPKNYHQAHDEATRRWNEKKNAIAIEKAKARNKEYNKMKDEYNKLFTFEENNLKIVVPDGCDDICREGQNLHHCVGTYIDRVCKGLSVILFVRDMKDLTKSFYTLELQGNEMIQCRGQNNKDMTPKVQKFITDFAAQKNLVKTRYMGGIA